MALRMRKNKVAAPLPGCPLTACLSLIGGAWTPNIIWYLSGGPRRFSELRADLDGISSKVLTQRLRELEESGVASRTVLPTSPPSVEYALTELGHELLPAIRSIVEIGHKLKSYQERRLAESPDHGHREATLAPAEPRKTGPRISQL
ncbi:helix-turn-helix domain-containing protein [Rhabdaerophilum sp. SD176]|uniref:winged helix-turn-helix transcriptional regulator n=1 Tax=Rhabdaerophilum sp. SD176 TaxID=2983548 RepID=UPI0024E009DE|nr:helix-turn-helix domain-containing protein [Rhabdaerophilum sp. SD176]